VSLRTLRYPYGWRNSHQPGEKPQEKASTSLAKVFVAWRRISRVMLSTPTPGAR
jgi:hypothetical protein